MFASKTAATQEKYADNAIGNVTGSNSVNVFLGLGLPWLMAAIFHESQVGNKLIIGYCSVKFVVYTEGLLYCDFIKQGNIFKVESGAVAFSVLIYSIVAFAALALFLLRRYLSVFGKAELGGPTISKWICGIFLVILWFVYVILSTLRAYNYISIA